MTEQNKKFWILVGASLACSVISEGINRSPFAGGLLHGFFVVGALVSGIAGVVVLVTGWVGQEDE